MSAKHVKVVLALCVALAILLTVAMVSGFLPARLTFDGGIIWVIVILLIVPILCALTSALVQMLKELREKMNRIQSFRELASRLGMSYSRRGRVKKVSHPRDVRAKDKRNVVLNLFKGTSEGHRVHAFEMAEYKDPGYEPLYSCFLLEHDGDFPLAAIEPREKRPPKEVKRLLRIRGVQEIKFEGDPVSDAFSQSFRVVSTDAEFARAVYHEDMVQYLLRYPDCAFNILGNGLTLTRWKALEPDNVESGLRQLAKICNLIPPDLLPAETVHESFLNVIGEASPGNSIEMAGQASAAPQASPKDNVLVHCRACGKEIFASMPACPYCNKPTTPPLRDGVQIVGQPSVFLRAQRLISAGVIVTGIILFSKGVGKWDTETGAHSYALIPGFLVTMAGLIWYLATRRRSKQEQR